VQGATALFDSIVDKSNISDIAPFSGSVNGMEHRGYRLASLTCGSGYLDFNLGRRWTTISGNLTLQDNVSERANAEAVFWVDSVEVGVVSVRFGETNPFSVRLGSGLRLRLEVRNLDETSQTCTTGLVLSELELVR
jgi:hypothetical protein